MDRKPVVTITKDPDGVFVEAPIGTELTFNLRCDACQQTFEWTTIYDPFDKGGTITCPHCKVTITYGVTNLGPVGGLLDA